MLRRKKFLRQDDIGLMRSQLYNEQSFYSAFIADAKRATHSIIIESPFISYKRMSWLYPMFQSVLQQGIKIIVNTRDPRFQDEFMQPAAAEGVAILQDLGAIVLFTGGHHRKLAIIDSLILWEGSLNILSQGDSCEVMRRIESADLAGQMIDFLELRNFLRALKVGSLLQSNII